MSSIKQLCKRTYGETMTSLGFKYANSVFYRTVNDVVQILELETTRYDIYIHYGIFPLCRPIYFDSWPRDPRCYFSWYREIRDGVKRDVEELMSATYKTISKKVLPAFEIGIDSKSAYEIRRYQWDSIFHDQDLTWLALKNHDYENAYLHLAAIVATYFGLIRVDTDIPKVAASAELREKIENWAETEESVLREEAREHVERFYSKCRAERKKNEFNNYLVCKKGREETLRGLCNMLDRIDQRDDEYFQERIAENERLFREFLERVEENPRKNWS